MSGIQNTSAHTTVSRSRPKHSMTICYITLSMVIDKWQYPGQYKTNWLY